MQRPPLLTGKKHVKTRREWVRKRVLLVVSLFLPGRESSMGSLQQKS